MRRISKNVKNRLVFRNNKHISAGRISVALAMMVSVMAFVLMPVSSLDVSAQTKIKSFSYKNIYKTEIATDWTEYNYSGESQYQYVGSSIDVTVPSIITSVNRATIVGNKKVKTVRIPSTVEYIEAGAFYDLPNLERVIFYGDTQVEEYAFYDCDSIRIFVTGKGTGAENYADENGINVTYIKTRKVVTSSSDNVFKSQNNSINSNKSLTYGYFYQRKR